MRRPWPVTLSWAHTHPWRGPVRTAIDFAKWSVRSAGGLDGLRLQEAQRSRTESEQEDLGELLEELDAEAAQRCDLHSIDLLQRQMS